MRKCDISIMAAFLLGAMASIGPAVACEGAFESACVVGKAIEKGAQETGSAARTEGYDLGNAIERGAKESGKVIQVGVHDTGDAIHQKDERDIGSPVVASPVVPSNQP